MVGVGGWFQEKGEQEVGKDGDGPWLMKEHLLKSHRWAKVVRIPTEVCDTSHLKVLMAPGRGLFCAVAPGGFNFLALSHMDLPSKGGTPQFLQF